MRVIQCGKSNNHNCAHCTNWSGYGSGCLVCKLPLFFCRYKFNLFSWCLSFFNVI